MTTHHRHSRIVHRVHRGMTLVETLVALLVLSIGLLGVAGLQMTSLQNNRGAHLRSQASVLAYDIADRMRANRTAALTGTGYTVALGAAPVGGSLLQLDLQNWKLALTNTLPGGDGQIDLLGGNVVRIRVIWTDSVGALQQFDTRTRI